MAIFIDIIITEKSYAIKRSRIQRFAQRDARGQSALAQSA